MPIFVEQATYFCNLFHSNRNDIGETCRQTCELGELFVILMVMSYRSTRPNGKTAYKQVELMDVGQTITPKIMRGDEILWQLEITRLS